MSTHWAIAKASSGGHTRATWAWLPGLETAIDAARELGEGFQLVLVRDGSRRKELERLASDVPPGQVEFLRSHPRRRRG
jgi:hypothetical protein